MWQTASSAAARYLPLAPEARGIVMSDRESRAARSLGCETEQFIRRNSGRPARRARRSGGAGARAESGSAAACAA
jgi:hypothetical protein